jgi:hypothetical protein
VHLCFHAIIIREFACTYHDLTVPACGDVKLRIYGTYQTRYTVLSSGLKIRRCI